MTTPPSVPQSLQAVFSPPESPDDEAKVTDLRLTTADIQYILTTMNYETERDTSNEVVSIITDLMKIDQCVAFPQLTFALDDAGQFRLVEGQDWLEAALQTGWTGVWIISCTWAPKQSASTLYRHLRPDTYLDVYRRLGII